MACVIVEYRGGLGGLLSLRTTVKVSGRLGTVQLQYRSNMWKYRGVVALLSCRTNVEVSGRPGIVQLQYTVDQTCGSSVVALLNSRK